MKLNKPQRLTAFSGGMAFSLCVFLLLLLSIVYSAVVQATGAQGSEVAKHFSYLMSPLAILITLAVMYAYCGVPAKSLFPVRTKPKYLLIGVALIFGLIFSLGILNELFVAALEQIGYVRRPSTLPDMSGWMVVPVLIEVAVLPAICEELLFRGMILNNAAEELGEVRSIFLVGFCFSLYHGSVEQTIYQFICGCSFALLAVRSRSVTPVVLIHFLNNALIIVLSVCGVYDESGSLVAPLGVLVTIYVLSAISLVASLALLIFEKTPFKGAEKGKTSTFFAGAAIGIIAMALQWISGLF